MASDRPLRPLRPALHRGLHHPRDRRLRLQEPDQVHRQHLSDLRSTVRPPHPSTPTPYLQPPTNRHHPNSPPPSSSPLLELANYTILGRILYYAPYHSPIHPGRVLTTFAFISFIIEVLNGNGVAYSVNQSLSPSQQSTGRALLKAALVLQLAVLALFTLLAGTFHRRCVRAGLRHPNILNALYTLYASTALLAVRTVFRVAEYWTISQHDFWRPGGIASLDELSPAIRYEWFFWVFEASLMLANHVLMNVRHPRRWLPRSARTYLARGDGVTEVEGPGYKDGRGFLVTVVDPFDVWGLVKGRGKEGRFWEAGEGGKVVRDGAAQV